MANSELPDSGSSGQAVKPAQDTREHKLERLNRTLRAIQHSGQALLRAVDEPAYLTQVCQNVVDDCGHMTAWIGYAEDSVQAVAWAGYQDNAQDRSAFTGMDAGLAGGPSDQALETSSMQLCREILAKPPATWRERTLQRGYRSILALPLSSAGRTFGVLTVCAGDPDAFSDQEIVLLSELADDLSFGIQTLRLRQAHAQTASALRLSQSDLNRAQAVGHIGSWRLDIRRNVLTFSTENHRIFGIPEETPLSYESFLDTVHPDDRELFTRSWQAALSGEPFEIDHRLLVAGSVKWVRERAELEFDAAGVLTGGFGTTQDITRRKLMEDALLRSETRFRQLVEQTSDGIFVHDANGHFVDVNQAGAEMYGYSRQEILNLGVSDLMMPEESGHLHEVLENSHEGQVVRAEWLARRKDGSSFMAEVALRRLHDGRSQSLVRDITERRQSEAERLIAMERQRDILVREVHHRIKNHLQGVIALMRNRIDTMPTLSGPLGEAISQIDTIAQVYGLQCRGENNRITVDGLVTIAVRSAGGANSVDLQSFAEDPCAELDAKEIVPVALVINELITNAIKHSTAGAVLITLSSSDGVVSVQIRNSPATLPDDSDFNAGTGLGTGLELVRGLLPPNGVSLVFSQCQDEVVVDFLLTRPVLLPRQNPASSST